MSKKGWTRNRYLLRYKLAEFKELCKRNNIQIMPCGMKHLNKVEYNQIGDYLLWKVEPSSLPKGKLNEVPIALTELEYKCRCEGFQILWRRIKET